MCHLFVYLHLLYYLVHAYINVRITTCPNEDRAPRRKIVIQRGCGTGRNDEIVVIIGWSAGAIANIFGARSGGTCWSAGALDKNESERGAEMGVGALER